VRAAYVRIFGRLRDEVIARPGRVRRAQRRIRVRSFRAPSRRERGALPISIARLSPRHGAKLSQCSFVSRPGSLPLLLDVHAYGARARH
jgi:hypothetical protein